MEFINDLLRSQSDNGSFLYNSTSTICIAVLVIATLLYAWRMKCKPVNLLKVIVISLITYYFLGSAQHVILWSQVGFDPNRFAQTGNVAVAFTLLPLVSWLCAKAFNISNNMVGEMLAVTTLSWHVFGRSGCTFTGCCYGFSCDWGLYSKQTGANQFPVFWLESLFTLGILIFLIVRMCRRGRIPDNGRALPYFLFFYGICRFFSEITRESTKGSWFFWRFSDVHIHMLIMAAVGGYLLYWNIKKTKAVPVEESPLPSLNGQRR